MFVCVCMSVCARLRCRRSCNQSSLAGLPVLSSLLSSLPLPLASFPLRPSARVFFFFIHDSPCGFLYPSLRETFAEQRCAVVTRRLPLQEEEEGKRKKRALEAEADRSITLLQGRKARGQTTTEKGAFFLTVLDF